MGKTRQFKFGTKTDIDEHEHKHNGLLPEGCAQGHVTSLNFEK